VRIGRAYQDAKVLSNRSQAKREGLTLPTPDDMFYIAYRGRSEIRESTPEMQQSSYQVFICRGVTCTNFFADDVLREMRKQVQKLGLAGRVQVERGGCYDRCGGGVTVVVRRTDLSPPPKDVVYPEVMEPEVRRIAVEHLVQGNPIAEMQEVRRGAKKPPNSAPACG
jgi:(2Fe-2S) ferredoxin